MKAKFIPAVKYIAKMIRLPDGEPIRLADHQVKLLTQTLTPTSRGRFPYPTVLHSEPKKSGKTTLAAGVASWALNTLGPRAEILLVGNDLEQSQQRLFAEVVRMQKAHPSLARRIMKCTDSLLLLVDGSTCKPLAMDAEGEAGANPTLIVHDEAWGIMSERGRRLFDELTPPPTRKLALRWISSYAGYSSESKLLEELYTRGLAGTRVRGFKDAYHHGSLFMYWSHTAKMPWQNPAYYAEQQSELRPSAFRRLHRNEWVSSEGTLLDPAVLDGAIDRDIVHRPPIHGMGVRYGAWADNAAGSRDDMVLAVGHCEGTRLILDTLCDQGCTPPYDPIAAIRRFAEVTRQYGIGKVHGDTSGGLYFKTEYLKAGLTYEVSPLTPTQLYEGLEVVLNQRTVRLLNHPKALAQLAALKEKGGRIGHAYGGFDDFAVAIAGLISLLRTWAGQVPYPENAIMTHGARIGVGGPIGGPAGSVSIERDRFGWPTSLNGVKPDSESALDRIVSASGGRARWVPDW